MTEAANPLGIERTISADELMRTVQKRVREAQKKAEQAKAAMADGEETATSAKNAVTVTVTPMGTIKSVRFGPESEKLTAAQLTTEFMTTYHKAIRVGMERTVQALESTLGPTMVSQQVRQAIAEIPDEESEGQDR